MTSAIPDDAPLILAVCQGGLVRSSGLKLALTYRYGGQCDVIALGIEGNSARLLQALSEQATHIVVMQRVLIEFLPEGVRDNCKLLLCEVGPDVYGSPMHQSLQSKIDMWIASGGAVVLGLQPTMSREVPSVLSGPTKSAKRPANRVPRRRRNPGDGQR